MKQKTVYITGDGKEWDRKEDAEAHERKRDQISAVAEVLLRHPTSAPEFVSMYSYSVARWFVEDNEVIREMQAVFDDWDGPGEEDGSWAEGYGERSKRVEVMCQKNRTHHWILAKSGEKYDEYLCRICGGRGVSAKVSKEAEKR
jgi:hypothetical protein